MIYSEDEILQYIEDNDVKFVKLTFCDGNGKMKNISACLRSAQHVRGRT